MNCEQGLKKALYTRAARKVVIVCENSCVCENANRCGSRGGKILLGTGSRGGFHGSQEGQ